MKHDLTFPVTAPTSLSDVINRLKGDPELSAQACREMTSAVNMVAKFLNLPPLSVEVDVPALRKVLEEVQPGRFNLSRRRLANIRSLFVAALLRTGAPVEPLRLNAALTRGWARLMSRLTAQAEKNALARFSQWCFLRGIEPEAVDDQVIADYRAAQVSLSFVMNAEKLVQNLVRSWNRSLATVDGWPKTALTATSRREIFMLPASTFPESFQRELDAWCHRLAGTDLLDDQPFKPLRPVSVKWHRENILRCASALTRQGHDPAAITSLSVLVVPEHAKLILLWFLGRSADGKPSKQTHDISAVLTALGRHWVELDEASFKKLSILCSKCRVKSSGMTAKNRDTLRLFDDERLVRALLGLPARLMRQALAGPSISKLDAYLASQALAIAILVNAPIRIENLATINIDKNILRASNGHRKKFLLRFPAHRVKNDLEIELPLAPETSDLLDRYLETAWPVLASPGCRDLFPGRSGEIRSKTGFGMAIAKITERELGVRVSPHQFRHITGYLYLKACPGDYETVRVLLGHKALQTTIQFYAGMEISAAAKRYDEEVLSLGRKPRGRGK
jgi:integrase